MKNNTFKIIITIGITITSISVGYYFLFFLPKSQRNSLMLKNQVECQKVGTALFAESIKKTTMISRVPVEPVFKFSSKINTCIQIGGWTYDTYSYYFLLNVYSNEILADYTYNMGAADATNPEARLNFKKIERELMAK